MSDEYIDVDNPVANIDPIPVHVASWGSSPIRRTSPEFGNCMTWTVDTLTNMGQPIKILPRRYRRNKARILVPSMGPLGTGTSASGQATSPAANQQLLTTGTAIPPGEYIIQWSVGLSGTLGAPEVNNFQLRLGGATIAISANPDVAGEFNQPNFGPVFISGQGPTVRVAALATVGAIYSAVITLIPVVSATGAVLVINSKQEPLTLNPPIGTSIFVPGVYEWESQQDCFAVLTPFGQGPVSVSIIDESYQED